MTAEDLSFWQIAQRRPDDVAIIDPDHVEHTFGDVLATCNQVAHALRAMSIGQGDAIAVVLRNSRAFYDVYLAAMQSGLYVVPVNYHSTASEMAYLLEDSGARAVFCSPDVVDAVAEAADLAGLPVERRFCAAEHAPAGFTSLADLRDGHPVDLPPDRIGGQVMQYTSGTTGRPKGVRREVTGAPADETAGALRWLLDLFGMKPGGDNVWLVTSPLYHTVNISLAGASLHLGMTLVLMDGWDSEGMLERVDRHGVTSTLMVPTQFVRLLDLDQATRDRYDLSTLDFVIHGAAPCPVEVKRELLAWWGPIIFEYYGSTEVGGTLASPEEWLQRPGTVGRPFPITTLRILDEHGDEVPTGEVGRVFMRQGDDQVEYKGAPDKTANARHGDLMTVGDLGYVDEDGFLYLVGRDAEIIISGGVNIYPAEVENVLFEHDWVMDAAVIGVPDAEFGESVRAVVQLSPDADADRAEEQLSAFVRSRLSGFKCPRGIDVVDRLPRDPNGKLYKQRLRDHYWQDAETRI